jgi:integrase
LKWGDIDFAAGVMNVTRSVVYGIVGPCKTESSQKPVPLHPLVAENLAQWRERSVNRKSEGWVFPSRRIGAGNRAGDTRSYADTFGQRQRTRESKNASDGILFAGLTQHF